MRSRRGRTVALASAGLGTLVLVVAAVSLREAAIEYWHLAKLESEDPAERVQAREWLSEHGAQRAILPLLRLHRAERVRSESAPMVVRRSSKPSEFHHALDALKECLKRSARSAAPTLATALRDGDEETRFWALERLDRLRVGHAAVPALVAALKDPSARVRLAAAGVLLLADTEKAVPVPLMLEWLKHAEPDVRATAAWVLWARGDAPDVVIPALIERLKAKDIPELVSEALAAYGDAAVSPLKALAGDPDPQVRRLAGQVLARIEATR